MRELVASALELLTVLAVAVGAGVLVHAFVGGRAGAGLAFLAVAVVLGGASVLLDRPARAEHR